MIDRYYRKLIILHKMFTQGWGSPDKMRRIFEFRKKISQRSFTQQIVSPDHPVYIDSAVTKKDVRLIEGHFYSPIADFIPELAPKESTIARFQMVLPDKWSSDMRPICLQLGGTGDHGFARRRNLIGLPLLKENGIGSIILENPFYGSRKPPKQFRSGLLHVIDLFTMGAGIILESQILFNWLEKEGYGPLGVTGISMGGFMASLAASNWHKPVSLIPCLSWSTASLVFTEDLLSESIPWKLLEKQLESQEEYYDNISLIKSPEPHWNNLFDNCAGHSPVHLGESSLTGHQSTSGNEQSGDQSNTDICDLNIDPDSAIMKNDSAILRNDTAILKNMVKAKEFMKGVMDECTHLANYEQPVDPELIVIVIAEDDYYVARKDLLKLNEMWPGSKLHLIKGRGHVTSVLRDRNVFREAIAESFKLHAEKYYSCDPTYVNER